MKRLIISAFVLALCCSILPAQVTGPLAVPGGAIAISSVTFSADAVASINSQIANGILPIGGITLAANITNTTTSFALSTASPTIQPFYGLQIGSEIMTVVVVPFGTGTVTVFRHTAGTTAAAHSIGDPVTVLQYGDIGTWARYILKAEAAEVMAELPASTIATAQGTIATTIANAVH